MSSLSPKHTSMPDQPIARRHHNTEHAPASKTSCRFYINHLADRRTYRTSNIRHSCGASNQAHICKRAPDKHAPARPGRHRLSHQKSAHPTKEGLSHFHFSVKPICHISFPATLKQMKSPLRKFMKPIAYVPGMLIIIKPPQFEHSQTVFAGYRK